jgi:hypothetical protein
VGSGAGFRPDEDRFHPRRPCVRRASLFGVSALARAKRNYWGIRGAARRDEGLAGLSMPPASLSWITPNPEWPSAVTAGSTCSTRNSDTRLGRPERPSRECRRDSRSVVQAREQHSSAPGQAQSSRRGIFAQSVAEPWQVSRVLPTITTSPFAFALNRGVKARSRDKPRIPQPGIRYVTVPSALLQVPTGANRGSGSCGGCGGSRRTGGPSLAGRSAR